MFFTGNYSIFKW